MGFLFPLAAVLCCLSTSTLGLMPEKIFDCKQLHHGLSCSRRDIVKSLGFGISCALVSAQPSAAHAFANKMSDQYDDRPKRRGPQPKDLGVATRINFESEEYLGLKPCGATPNCFTSSMTIEDDPDHSIPAWKYPASYNQKQAFDELQTVIQSYPPGQSGVDGGGFEIKTFDANKGYMYVSFEALKNGYIDDFEAAVVNGLEDRRAVQVRSSSRVGYLDYGVNAKRLNYIAKELRGKGWDAEGVDFNTHRRYALENEIK